jgi:cytochrome c biogenesis protein CcmG/thiol:disulfide interchange protein DsbE
MNWRRSAAGAAIAVPFVALLAFGLTRDPRAIPSPLPGRSAPDFRLAVMRPGDYPAARIPRDTAALSDLRGQVVVLNFWASWCLACRDEHAALSAVAREYAGRGVQFFGPVYNDSPTNAARWIEAMGGQAYPSLLDPGSRTAIDYGLYGVPETFFIARDGTVAYKHVGPVTEALLRRKIDSLRAGAAEP